MTSEELKEIEERYKVSRGFFQIAMKDIVGMGITSHKDVPRLLAYIKELESQIPRWIPVEERLPEEKAIVTACIKNRRVFPDVFYIEGCWYSAKGIVEGVTHWMPLPTKPEDEE